MIVTAIVRFASSRKGTVRCALAIAAVGAPVFGHHGSAWADPVVSCGGFAMLGGAQINCSHLAPKQPTQFCTFSWSLTGTNNALQVVDGAFVVPPGANNMTVYQGAGFTSALAPPIVLCQGKRSR